MIQVYITRGDGHESKMKEHMMRKSMAVGWMMEQFSEEEKMEIAVKKLEVKMKMMETRWKYLK